MEFCVAGLAQAHKILPCVRAALTDRDNVMDLLDRREPAFLEAHLTKWMLCDVTVANAFPCPSVLLVYVGGAFVFIVGLPCHFAVPLTVLTVCEFGTSGIRTRSFRSRWHIFHLPGHKKASRAYPVRLSLCCFHDSIIYLSAVNCNDFDCTLLLRLSCPPPSGRGRASYRSSVGCSSSRRKSAPNP